jgi:hypothetical protein
VEVVRRNSGPLGQLLSYLRQVRFAIGAMEGAAISQSHLHRQFNELILVRVAAFGEGLEDLREKKEL